MALTVVRGPGGVGKTTLVADWVVSRRSRKDAVWVTCGSAIGSPTSLWGAMFDALESSGWFSPSDLRRARLELDDDAHRLAAVIRLLDSHDGELLVVLDEYDTGEPESAVHDELCRALSEVQGLSIVAVGRDLAALVRRAATGRFESQLIGRRDLALTPEETLELCALHGIADLDHDILTTVHAQAGGGALGVRMGIATLNEMRREQAPITSAAYALRWGEVMRRGVHTQIGDERARELIARTTVAPYFSIELGSALVPDDADHLEHAIALAERAGLGNWADVPRVGRVFRYIPAVRGALSADLRQRQQRLWGQLARVSARWLVERGQIVTGALLAANAGDWSHVNRLVPRMLLAPATAEPSVWWETFRKIPLRTLRSYPLIAMMIAVGYNTRPEEQRRANEYFALALVAAKARALVAPPEEKLYLDTLQSGVFRVIGRWSSLWAPTRRALEAIARGELASSREARELMLIMLHQLGLSAFYSGRTEEALGAFARLSEEAARLDDQAYRNVGYAEQAGILAARGDLHQARSLLSRIDPDGWPASWRAGYRGVLEHLALSVVALEDGAVAEAIGHIDALEEHLPTLEHEAILGGARALARLRGGAAREAMHQYVSQLRARAATSRPIAPSLGVPILMTSLCLAARNYDEMRRWLRRVRKDDVRGIPVRALVDTLEGDPSAALRRIARHTDRALEHPRVGLEGAVIGAVAALRAGHSGLAADFVERAVLISREQGLSSAFSLVPERDRGELLALVAARSAPDTHGYTARMLDMVAAVVPDQIAKSPLSPRERDVLSELLVTGSQAEIAATLQVSVNTVKAQLRSIYRKLGANSRDSAIAAALEQGLLEVLLEPEHLERGTDE